MNEPLLQKIKEAVIAERKARAGIIEAIGEVDRIKAWQTLGYKSLKGYCTKELGFTDLEAREILISLGQILTGEKMVDADPLTQTRIDMLKLWRKEKSKTDSLSPFMILSNRTIMEIARHNPKDTSALLSIPGMGEAKVNRFGQQILDLL